MSLPPAHPKSPARKPSVPAPRKWSQASPIAEEESAKPPGMPAKKYTPTVKAYKNAEFLGSSQARLLRIMCEYEETMLRLKRHKIRATILVFGSARAKSREEWAAALAAARALEAAAAAGEARAAATKAARKIERTAWMGDMTDKIVELSRLLTAWGVSDACHLGRDHSISGVTRYHFTDPRYASGGSGGGGGGGGNGHPRRLGSNVPSYGVLGEDVPGMEQGVYICTGGGPGFMEAANKGAAMVPGAKNMGMGITLPFEDGLNEFVTPELAFEFHYFFTRKFWMVYHCQALVVAPGGFGTLDELFEVLTLKQTGKIQQTLPVVLFGKTFWQTVVNWQALVDFGTIAQDDVNSLLFTDSEHEAFEFLVASLSKNNAHN
ncbi:hypothetical protein JKP88DRAFT_258437 [Tribonema minus]|uniref:Lysine decarboxylase family protein n=1 Tax=Tribonema minus TaxID=303371 RepID=A0A835YYD6_9STRA|nr:hypothetical protein JKP88DRAFT_258437 [Tribonema minus]